MGRARRRVRAVGCSVDSVDGARRAGRVPRRKGNVGGMCRNITTLRGLEPAATSEEIEAAARQYVRKVSGVQSATSRTQEPFERAVALVAQATRELLAEMKDAGRRHPAAVGGGRRRARARQHDPGLHDTGHCARLCSDAR